MRVLEKLIIGIGSVVEKHKMVALKAKCILLS